MATEVVYEMYRGDDLLIPMNLRDPQNSGTPVNITGWTIRSMARYAKRLIEELDVTIINAAQGQFTLSVPAIKTGKWPVRDLRCDIEFNRPEGKISSNTFVIKVKEDQTYD